MDMASKFILLRTSTLLFEILSLFEIFYEENTCNVTQFYLLCQAAPFQDRRYSEECICGVLCQSFPQIINWVEPDFDKMMPGLVHLMHALICTGFMKFLGSPLPVFFLFLHGGIIHRQQLLTSTVAMKN